MEILPTFFDGQPAEFEFGFQIQWHAVALAFGHFGISLFGTANPHA